MILITGAAGKTGQAIAHALKSKHQRIRALVFRNEQVSILKNLGVDEIVVGNIQNLEVLRTACKGIQKIYHICPNMSPDEVAIGKAIISAATKADIEHFVYHSVLHPQTIQMPHHWQKMQVEALLFESALPFTILQPCAYMQNIYPYWDEISNTQKFTLPYAATTCLSFIDLTDLAEAASIVLCEPGHINATYELCGTDGISAKNVAKLIGKFLETNISVEKISIETWEKKARLSGLGSYQISSLASMFRYYDAYNFTGNTWLLSQLLKRQPVSLSDFLSKMVYTQ